MLLLVDSGSRTFREYILRNAYLKGMQICLLKEEPATWENKWVKETMVLSEFGSGGINQYNFQGITTYVDTSLQKTADLAEKLGLPYYPSSLVARCQDKYRLRRFMEERGLPSIESHLVHNVNDALKWSKQMGYPLVIKPLKGHGSISVYKVESTSDIMYYFEKVSSVFFEDCKFVIEPYLDGPEVSVEVLVYKRNIIFLGITDKLLSEEPFFEEVGHVFPAYQHIEKHKEVQVLIEQIVKAFEIQQGAFHAEVRMTSDGPRLVELNLRLGGDFIPRLVHLATGVDFATCGLEIALGQRPETQEAAKFGAAVRFLIPKRKGRILKIEGMEIFEHPQVIDYSIRDDIIGLEVNLPPEQFLTRLGYVIVKANSPQEADQLSAKIIEGVRIYYDQ
jgi:biotin carboxylase